MRDPLEGRAIGRLRASSRRRRGDGLWVSDMTEDELLRWSKTKTDEELLAVRALGPATLAKIRSMAAGMKEHEHVFQLSYRVRGEKAWWQGDGANATAYPDADKEHAYVCSCGAIEAGTYRPPFVTQTINPDGTTEDALRRSSDLVKDLLLENQRLRGSILPAPPGRCPCGSVPIPADILTPAQLRALEAIAHGRTYRQAAKVLGISHQTLKVQLSSAYDRLGVQSSIGALHAIGYVRVP